MGREEVEKGKSINDDYNKLGNGEVALLWHGELTNGGWASNGF